MSSIVELDSVILNNLIHVYEKIWKDTWTDRQTYRQTDRQSTGGVLQSIIELLAQVSKYMLTRF